MGLGSIFGAATRAKENGFRSKQCPWIPELLGSTIRLPDVAEHPPRHTR